MRRFSTDVRPQETRLLPRWRCVAAGAAVHGALVVARVADGGFL
jgi:hypothetical protein